MAGDLKQDVTRAARDVLAASYPEGTHVRRTGASCHGAVAEVFVCFNIQHTQWRPEDGVRFCVNWGVVPQRSFAADPFGRGGRHPSYLDCPLVARGRLTPDPVATGDRWHELHAPEALGPALAEIRESAARLWADRLAPMLTEDWHRAELRKLPTSPIASRLLATLAPPA